MKLKSKLKLYEEFTAQLVNEAAGDSSPVSQINSVAIDQTKSQPSAAEIIRTEVIRDVDTILNNLIELSDRVEEASQLEIDELYEELFSLMNINLINEGILDIIKSPIKYAKIQANMKKYQKALVQQAISDIDFAKKKEASKEDPNPKKMEVLKQAHAANKLSLKDQLDAIAERMTQISDGDEGLLKVVALGKTKSKLNAAKMVMKAASGEEAKALKLKVETLEDRIADDEKSLKDYAAQAGPTDKEKADKEAQDAADRAEIEKKAAEDTKNINTDEAPTKKETKGKKEGEEEETDPNAEKIAALDTKIDGLKKDKKAKEDQLNSKNHPDVLAAETAIKSAELEKAKLEDDPESVASAENALKAAKDDQKAAVATEESTEAKIYEGMSIAEALKASNPNEVETIEVDMSYEDEDLKDVKAVWKQFNLKVKELKGGQGTEHEVTGKKKDILAYLQSEFYEMDAESIEEFYPELLEGKAKVKESTKAKIYEGMSIAERFKALM